MRGTSKLLVWRSCEIDHIIVKLTILLLVLLRMRSRKIFIAKLAQLPYLPHFCQMYYTVVNSITQ